MYTTTIHSHKIISKTLDHKVSTTERDYSPKTFPLRNILLLIKTLRSYAFNGTPISLALGRFFSLCNTVNLSLLCSFYSCFILSSFESIELHHTYLFTKADNLPMPILNICKWIKVNRFALFYEITQLDNEHRLFLAHQICLCIEISFN